MSVASDSVAIARSGCSEADFNMKPAVGLAAGRDGGVVGVGDGLDDREAEPEPGRIGSARGVESLERLKDPLEFAGSDCGAGVRDRDDRSAVPALGCQLDAAAGGVVADRVRDEVGDEPFDETRIARRAGGLEVHVEGKPVVVCRRCGGGGDGGEVDGLVAREAALAAREGEQCFDQAQVCR